MNLHRLNRILLETLLLPVVAMMMVSGALVLQILTTHVTVNRIQMADRNIATANLISALIADEETGIRGYQNTSNEIFLQPYNFAAAPLQSNFARLRSSLDNQSDDAHILDEVMAQHRRWVSTVADPMILLVRSGLDTRDSGLNLRGKAVMDNQRVLMRNLVESQKTQRTALIDHWRMQVRHTLIAVVGSSLVMGLMIGVFARDRLHLVSDAFQETLAALRRQAQTTHDSEQRLRTILDSIGDGVIVCDASGRIELLNPRAQQLTGFDQSEAFHRPLDSVLRLVDEETREPLQGLAIPPKARLGNSFTKPGHAILLRRNEQELHIDQTASPVYDRAGTVGGTVMVFRDITEQRRTQTALLASEKMAVAGRLAATIAHEIHNPLDSVVNLLYLMKAGVTPEESEQFLDMASAELNRVTQISRSMLGMYRESKVPVVLDVSEIFESLFMLLEPQLSHTGIHIKSDLEPGSLVSGFPAELRQVFTNLLTNAADASSRGGSIEVSVRRTTASAVAIGSAVPRAAGVFISITDHGPGMPPGVLDNLFQPFFTTKGEHGTGLGLWVSQGIVQKHNGTIRLDSRTETPTHGTTVSVFLPRGEAGVLQADFEPQHSAATA